MEHPHPIHLDKPSIAALENFVLASEDGAKVIGNESLPLRLSPAEANIPNLISPTNTMATWSITSQSTPPPAEGLAEADMTQQLRKLSESALWYDEALFSPAITVPRANTSNPDWYGGIIGRGTFIQSGLDFYNSGIFPPQQDPTTAAWPPDFAILPSGQFPTSTSNPVQTSLSNSSNWPKNLHMPVTQIHSAQPPNTLAVLDAEEPIQLSTTLAYLNSSISPSITLNPESSLPQTTYTSPLETPSFETPCHPPRNQSLEDSEELGSIWSGLLNGVSGGNSARQNCLPKTYGALENNGPDHASSWSVNQNLMLAEEDPVYSLAAHRFYRLG